MRDSKNTEFFFNAEDTEKAQSSQRFFEKAKLAMAQLGWPGDPDIIGCIQILQKDHENPVSVAS
jgi:hypothetical protein